MHMNEKKTNLYTHIFIYMKDTQDDGKHIWEMQEYIYIYILSNLENLTYII